MYKILVAISFSLEDIRFQKYSKIKLKYLILLRVFRWLNIFNSFLSIAFSLQNKIAIELFCKLRMIVIVY